MPTHAEVIEGLCAERDALRADLAAALAERDALRAALAHYADEKNWRLLPCEGRYVWVYGDRRFDDVARAALAGPGPRRGEGD